MRLSMTPCSITSLLVLCLKAEGVATVHKCVQQLERGFIIKIKYSMNNSVYNAGDSGG